MNVTDLFDELTHAGWPVAETSAVRGGRVSDRAERAYVEFWVSRGHSGQAAGFVASGPPWLLCSAERICREIDAQPDIAFEVALQAAVDSRPPPADRGSLRLLLEDALAGLRAALAKTA